MLFLVPGGIGSKLPAPGGNSSFALLCGERATPRMRSKNVGRVCSASQATGTMRSVRSTRRSKHDLLRTRPFSRFLDKERAAPIDGRSGRGENTESQSAEIAVLNDNRTMLLEGRFGIRIRAFAREAALLRRLDAEHPVPFAAHERPLLPGLGTDGAQRYPQGQCACLFSFAGKVPLHARAQSGRRRAGRHMEAPCTFTGPPESPDT